MLPMNKKSPIKKPPLPQAGESSWFILDERWSKLVSVFVTIPGFLAMIAAIEWCHRLFALPVNPWLWTVLFLLALPLSIVRVRRGYRELNWRLQGFQGERVVGQSLEDLRPLGCRVYHDISEDGYNIDHVVIAPNGIFAIETKAPSKPAKGQCQAIFDGEAVMLTGCPPDRDSVIQAKSAANRVRDILREMTGQEHRVLAVLLYVDWFVTSTAFHRGIHVMNQDYFVKAFENLGGNDMLSMDSIQLLGAGLERYLRAKAER
jgi:hypothetical protein